MPRKSQKTLDFSTYNIVLKSCLIKPNFFVSEDYFEHSGIVILEEKSRIRVLLDGVDFLPPVVYNQGIIRDCGFEILVDFEGYLDQNLSPKFFDYEFIYSPKNFLDISGGDWRPFRKNVKKFFNKGYEYKSVLDRELLLKILEIWAGNREIHDVEVFIKFILNSNTIMGLWYKDRLLGYNIWDENYFYTNFRYCVDDHSEPFLQEYLRYLFYIDMANKQVEFVNDGGCLGSGTIFRFKKKLNPAYIKERYLWTKTKKENYNGT